MDKVATERRSANMSKIRSVNTRPEVIVRRLLFSIGLRFRLHDKNLPGHPDIVLRKYKTVVFVNGCFWHGHQNCKRSTIPQTNTEFWRNKIEKNKNRDKACKEKLIEMGWDVVIVWECELKDKESLLRKMKLIFGK